MPSDARAAAAREHHRRSLAAGATAKQEQEARNRLIRQLREEDPESWTYGTLAKATGMSPELVAAVLKGRRG